MRIATWNVNSLRARLDRVLEWIGSAEPDVLALQETKLRDGQFPEQAFADLGYAAAHHGLSQWNGVAILSRVGLTEVERGFPGVPHWGEPAVAEPRAIGARCGDLRVWSLYAPNGRGLADPHLAYKLDWLAALRQAGTGWLAADPGAQLALMGDWNIAPRDEDVWDIAAFAGSTHVSPAERAALQGVLDAGFEDVALGPTEGAFTYWDYKQLRFARREGMRIDLVLGSRALAARVTGAAVDRQQRKGKGASDHAPLVVELGDPRDH